MSVLQQKKKLTPEERKAMREKYSIHDKQGEAIYRHYGDLDGADFKLFKNKNCEIYILDWSKGMFIDDCENCNIVVGPIDGSVFIRKCKNCKVSIIARQVRFRECQNLDIFTYCPSDPAVESSFNIFFAPFNAFFPHLSELFLKGGFNPEEKNHIDTPYDFTPSEVLGDGAQHFSLLSEDKFFIKTINDGDAPLDELFKGYSQKEQFLINKENELPKLGEININNNNKRNTNINIDDYGFGDNNENVENSSSIKNSSSINTEVFKNIQTNPQKDLNDMIQINNNVNNNMNNIMSMDDFISPNNNNISNQNTTINFDNFNFGNNNMNNINNNNMNNNMNNNIAFNNLDNQNQQNSFKSYDISKQTMTKEQEEEIQLEQIRLKAKEIREERIRGLMEKEAKLKNEILIKASNYMNQFYQERKKKIEINHKKLLEQENNQNKGNNSGNVWENISSNMTGSSSGADRMKETILNKSKQDQNN